MTQQGFDVAPPRFSVGGVIGASLQLLRRHFWQFFAVAFVLGLPLLALSLLLSQFPMPMLAPVERTGAQIPPGQAAGALLSMAVGFVGVLTYFVIQSAINFGALQDLRGARPQVGACIARGLAVLPRVFLAALLLFLAIFALTFVAVLLSYGIAMLLAATTGQGPTISAVSAAAAIGVLALTLFLFVSWWVFVPVIVVENAGPVACFRRSRALTKGHRWGILAIVLLVFVANFAAGILVGVIGQFGVIATAALLNVVVALAFTALSAVLTAVGYYTLRAEREGFGLPDLARVFD